jgi:inhibitor of cysteine peptidase
MMDALMLTASDDGAPHEVGVGQTVVIQLTESPSTGYRWTLETSNPNTVEVVDTRWEPSRKAQTGGAGRRVFRIVVRGTGLITLALKLWREWQGEGSVLERRQFTLVSK